VATVSKKKQWPPSKFIDPASRGQKRAYLKMGMVQAIKISRCRFKDEMSKRDDEIDLAKVRGNGSTRQSDSKETVEGRYAQDAYQAGLL
jgi:hypothetical protein